MARPTDPTLPFQDDDDLEVTTAQREVRPLLMELVRQTAGLELVKGPGAPHVFPLYNEMHCIGRARGADILVDSAELSRRHAVLALVESEWRIEDLDSRNGIFLNGIKIHSAILRDGDRLQLGELIFLFHRGR